MAGKSKAKGRKPRGRKSPGPGAAKPKRKAPAREKARKSIRTRPATPSRGPEGPFEGLGQEELEKKRVGELEGLAGKMGMPLRAVRKTETIEEIIRKAPTSYKGKGTAKRMEPPARRQPQYAQEPGAARQEGPLSPVIEEEPEDKKGYGPEIVRALPERDIVTAVAVEPRQLFAFWELTEKTAKKGAPALRVQDVTKGGKGAVSPLDIKLPGRTGGLYIEVRPGRQYVIQAGVFGPGGRFLPARKSRKVSTPPAVPSEEKAVLPRRYFRFHPVRYHG